MTKYQAGDEVTTPRPNGRPRKYDEPCMRLRVPTRFHEQLLAEIAKLIKRYPFKKLD